MTTAAVAARPGAPALGRVAAALAVASALVHVLLVDASSLASLAMAATAAVCLPCAWRLWRRSTASAWRVTVLADVTMLALHLQVLAEPAAGGTAHAAHAVHAGAAHGGLAGTGLVLVAGSLTAGAVALVRRPGRRREVPPPAGARA